MTDAIRRWMTAAAILVGASGCGNQWTPGDPPHTRAFPLDCAHQAATCESCHPSDQPIGKLDPACAGCHLEDRPESHDPEATATCEECHQDPGCSWNGAGSPHPAGFSEPDQHGMEAKLGGPTEGACTSCHGADLTGGVSDVGTPARGCDDCHATNDHADWRTDCVFCHGGTDNGTGAPPADIDNRTTDLSFAAHTPHVGTDPSYRALECLECHESHNDAMSPGHWFDGTSGLAEVSFVTGIADATTYDAGTKGCANNYCHGQGQRDDGAARVGDPPMTCDTCHAFEAGGWSSMSGMHETHLEKDDTITCNDCHAAVIDRGGDIATAPRHVDGTRDVAFFETSISTANNGGTCQGVCHGTEHDATFGWGHVGNYEEPQLHGYDSNLQLLECRSCHGSNWDGGIAQNCDDCHATEGAADWRTDCTFCHGGENGDQDGLPPQDINDETDPTAISFENHPDHHGTSAVNGHPVYDCTQCHVKPDDAMFSGHAIDGTPGRAEVDLSGGWSFEGGFDPVSGSCSNMYCHGNGQTPSGTITIGGGGLDCESCHVTETGWAAMSGTHEAHLQQGDIACTDCHGEVVNAANDIVDDDLHVNRVANVEAATTGWNGETCTTTCHGVNHDQMGWSGPHPDGFDDPAVHGQEALKRLQDCTDCHGANLEGGIGPTCDDCHTTEGHADWRSDCVFCHGGAAGDTSGAPPEDIDNTTAVGSISFPTHLAHLDNDIHPQWDCATCHQGSDTYVDAPTDPGHWLDDTTNQVAEVNFTGIANPGTYAAGNCSNNACHGNGQVNGTIANTNTTLDCEGCHSTEFQWTDMSGTHATHLSVTGVKCTDCHSQVVNAAGDISTPNKHVDGAVSVSTTTAGFTFTPPGANDQYTCTGTCHSENHTAWSWVGGHPPGYEEPEVHGQEALFQVQECRDCHGDDANGGTSGQGCDTCHDAGWRSDCTFCHGGSAGDTQGVPPSDLDNNTNEASISFMSHPEHVAAGDHPTWDCVICHDAGNYTDAWDDVGHWWDDGSIGVAEVDMSGSLAPTSTWNTTTNQCSNNYCHSGGKSGAVATVTDSNNAKSCTGCHGDPPNTGEHGEHDNYPCSDCHSDINSSGDFTQPTKHVNGLREVADGSGTAIVFTLSGGKWTCNGSCHDGHSNENW
ncbi:MAG: CxxxxCH/CxxCH domain-containing protein [Myxococcota bacterium]